MEKLTFNDLPEAVATLISRVEELSLKISGNQITSNQHTGEHVDLITREEASKILGVTLPTLHSWTLNGKVNGYRIGRRVRYKRHELEQALQAIK